MMTEQKLLKIMRECAEASEARWEMAIETDDMNRGFAESADECAEAYAAAIECLENCYEGYLGDVRTHLDEASQLESNAGDNQDACRALDALNKLEGTLESASE